MTGPLQAAPLCGREVASLQALQDELANNPQVERVLDNDQYAAYADQGARTVWTFTKPGHPAAPAVVCRRPVQNGNQISVQLQAGCGGPKEACDAMIAAFQALPVR
jgi:hypothetical protein